MLSKREKKLIIMWQAERAVVEALIKEFGNAAMHKAVADRTKLIEPMVLKDFNGEELLEIKMLAAHLPKY